MFGRWRGRDIGIPRRDIGIPRRDIGIPRREQWLYFTTWGGVDLLFRVRGGRFGLHTSSV